MNQPNFTASSNDCARAIVAIVEKVTGQSLPMETCSRIVACVSIELKHSHAQLVEQNERMRQALAFFVSFDDRQGMSQHIKDRSGNDQDAQTPEESMYLDGISAARAALNPPPTK